MPAKAILHSNTTRAVRWLDAATEWLLYVVVIFTPWAFGTTQSWSIQAVNLAGYALGVIWLAKICLRRRCQATDGMRQHGWRYKTALLLTVGVLGYVFVSAWNAEFVYVAREWRQEPLAHLKWLPHSLDRDATWSVFWNWLALASYFWAAHDWLQNDLSKEGTRRGRRLRRLFCVAGINGALVALEGVLQRNSGTNKLLWFMPTRDNPTAEAQFGPYAYRSNAAQLFNLLWPAALAVWWQKQFARESRSQLHYWLLPTVMLLMAGSLVSLSRGGFSVTIFQLFASLVVLLASGRVNRWAKAGFAVAAACTLASAYYFTGDQLAERLQGDPLSGRSETYRLAEKMADDYPWFGVGPGAFGSVFQFYRNSPADYWPGQLHNDWLEFLITFGRLGTALLVACLLTIVTRWFTPGGIRVPGQFAALIGISLAGCLLHARFDFPLQIYSIQLIFILWCAALFAVSRAEYGQPK